MSEQAKEGTYRGLGDIYRENWKWDKVSWASHCIGEQVVEQDQSSIFSRCPTGFIHTLYRLTPPHGAGDNPVWTGRISFPTQWN